MNASDQCLIWHCSFYDTRICPPEMLKGPEVLCWSWCKQGAVRAWLVHRWEIPFDFRERYLFEVRRWVLSSSENKLFKHVARLHCRRPHPYTSSTSQCLQRWHPSVYGGCTLPLGSAMAYWILFVCSKTYIFSRLWNEKSNKRENSGHWIIPTFTPIAWRLSFLPLIEKLGYWQWRNIWFDRSLQMLDPLTFHRCSYIILPNEIGQVRGDINSDELCCKSSANAMLVDNGTTIS